MSPPRGRKTRVGKPLGEISEHSAQKENRWPLRPYLSAPSVAVGLPVFSTSLLKAQVGKWLDSQPTVIPGSSFHARSQSHQLLWSPASPPLQWQEVCPHSGFRKRFQIGLSENPWRLRKLHRVGWVADTPKACRRTLGGP